MAEMIRSVVPFAPYDGRDGIYIARVASAAQAVSGPVERPGMRS